MAVEDDWTLDKAPRLDGKVAIVTGATGGLGYEPPPWGWPVSARSPSSPAATPTKARGPGAHPAESPRAKVRFNVLDLASLASVARFAAAVSTAHRGVIDILVNNAGVMGPPARQVTEDGFERQFGVNHLGHFALTARLKDALRAAGGGGRVVSVASLAHRQAALDLDDPQSVKSYGRCGRTAAASSPCWCLRSSCTAARSETAGTWSASRRIPAGRGPTLSATASAAARPD